MVQVEGHQHLRGVILVDQADPGHTGLARVLGNTGHLIPVTGPRKPVYGVMARNVQQTMALDLLMDDDVKLVTLLQDTANPV
mgnify:CR=1 FL=1